MSGRVCFLIVVVVYLLSWIWLFCDPMDCSLPGSSVHEISQARMLAWITMPSSRGSSPPRDRTSISCIAGGFFTTESPGSEVKAWGLPKAKKGLWTERKLKLASGTRSLRLQVWLQIVAGYQQTDRDHKPLGRQQLSIFNTLYRISFPNPL